MHPRTLPPKDFGAQLFANLKGDSSESVNAGEQLPGRRRAFTEMDELLNNDMRSGNVTRDGDLNSEANRSTHKIDRSTPLDFTKEKQAFK